MRKALILLSLFLSSRAAAEPWTAKEMTLFSSYIGLNIADVVLTKRILNIPGGEEQNPIYGSQPSTGSLVAGKTVGVGITYLIADNSNNRTSALVIANLVQLLIVRHNQIQLNF